MSEQPIIKKDSFEVIYNTIDSIICINTEYDKFRISIPRCEFVIENKKIYGIYGDMKILIMYDSDYYWNIATYINMFKKLIYIKLNIGDNYKFYKSNCHIGKDYHNVTYFYNDVNKIYLSWDRHFNEYLLSRDKITYYDFETFSLVPLKLPARDE